MQMQQSQMQWNKDNAETEIQNQSKLNLRNLQSKGKQSHEPKQSPEV
jgi:hypothetical protein